MTKVHFDGTVKYGRQPPIQVPRCDVQPNVSATEDRSVNGSDLRRKLKDVVRRLIERRRRNADRRRARRNQQLLDATRKRDEDLRLTQAKP